MCSTSLVDNVEHVYVPQLAQGRYDLQVWKAGGIPGLTIVSAAEPYALAWEFFSTFLTATPSGGDLLLSLRLIRTASCWHRRPASCRQLFGSTGNNPAPVVTNGQNQVGQPDDYRSSASNRHERRDGPAGNGALPATQKRPTCRVTKLSIMIVGTFRILIAAVFVLAAQRIPAADETFPATIQVHANKPVGDWKPVWQFFGADEPNYATWPNGRNCSANFADWRRTGFISAPTIC